MRKASKRVTAPVELASAEAAALRGTFVVAQKDEKSTANCDGDTQAHCVVYLRPVFDAKPVSEAGCHCFEQGEDDNRALFGKHKPQGEIRLVLDDVAVAARFLTGKRITVTFDGA